jgi:hypothetical protein
MTAIRGYIPAETICDIRLPPLKSRTPTRQTLRGKPLEPEHTVAAIGHDWDVGNGRDRIGSNSDCLEQ